MTNTSNPGPRSAAPVFVLGSPRSGTTLLYDMLLSGGGFTVYLAESNVFNVLAPSFGDFSKHNNRERLLKAWLGSKLFRASGLNAEEVETEVLNNCRTPGDFMRIVMDSIARQQRAQRWAENSPEGILHLPLIKRQVPNALVIHIIRDGRDVAMSLSRTRYLKPFPWQDRISLTGAGIYWQWIVEHGRRYGRQLGPDYLEVHFEDLVSEPQKVLNRIGAFIDHDLNYDRILQVGYGSVSKPNTSFRSESAEKFSPVGRWKQGFSAAELKRFESIVGSTMTDLGYQCASDARELTLEMRATRWLYRRYFDLKLWFKQQPLARAIHPLTSERIDAMVLAEDHPPVLKPATNRVDSAVPSGGSR